MIAMQAWTRPRAPFAKCCSISIRFGCKRWRIRIFRIRFSWRPKSVQVTSSWIAALFQVCKTCYLFLSIPPYSSRGGLLLDSEDWSVDQSPERQQPRKSFEIQKPRLSRVQLPTWVFVQALVDSQTVSKQTVYSFADFFLKRRHFSIDDVERSENDFERAQWFVLKCPTSLMCFVLHLNVWLACKYSKSVHCILHLSPDCQVCSRWWNFPWRCESTGDRRWWRSAFGLEFHWKWRGGDIQLSVV